MQSNDSKNLARNVTTHYVTVTNIHCIMNRVINSEIIPCSPPRPQKRVGVVNGVWFKSVAQDSLLCYCFLLKLQLWFIRLYIFLLPLWSSGVVILATDPEARFRIPALPISWEVMGMEQGPLSLVSTAEELLEREGSGSGLENLKYGRRDPSRWPHDTLYPQKLALTSATTAVARSI
jgi:hypothetical protein